MRVLVVRLKTREGRNQKAPNEYQNSINFSDYKQIANLLSDLEAYGANIEKAIEEFKKKKLDKFPW